jgi:tetratricopeptide (TPR) repeat protein
MRSRKARKTARRAWRSATCSCPCDDLPSAEKEAAQGAFARHPAERVLPLLAKAMAQQGEFKELLEQVTPEAAAKSAPLLTLRGDALLATGKADEAKQAYDEALALNPNSGDALLGQARYAMFKGDRDAAERWWRMR